MAKILSLRDIKKIFERQSGRSSAIFERCLDHLYGPPNSSTLVIVQPTVCLADEFSVKFKLFSKDFSLMNRTHIRHTLSNNIILIIPLCALGNSVRGIRLEDVLFDVPELLIDSSKRDMLMNLMTRLA